MTHIDKVRILFEGMAGRDAERATRFIDPGRYVEHDPRIGDGVEGLKRYIGGLSPDDRLELVRAFGDGDFVVTQASGQVGGAGTFFDVFRFEHGLVVEHWGFSSPAGPPNRSGHTQVDGPVEARSDVDTSRTKALVRSYYETVHLAGRRDRISDFMPGDVQIRHEPGVADGVAEFLRDLEVITRDRTIDEIRLLIGEGDFVFLVARGTHRGAPCAYVDLYRVEDDRLVEHWGFPQPIPPDDQLKNRNGMLGSSGTAREDA